MSIEGTKQSMVDAGEPGAIEETAEQTASQGVGEGIGVFRGLLLTALLYLALGVLVWFAWHAFTHWRGR